MLQASDKKILWLILILILMGIATWQFMPKKNSISLPSLPPVDKQIAESNALTSAIKAAAEAWDIKLCPVGPEELGKNCQDIVYLGRALKSKEIKDCQPIQNRAKQIACRKKLIR